MQGFVRDGRGGEGEDTGGGRGRCAASRTAIRAVLACAICSVAVGAAAEVTRVEVTSRAPLSYSGYEKVVGRVHFAVDPANPRNAVVVDLDKAPRNGQGLVEFSADFYVVRPTTGGNGVAIVDVVNRGRKTVIPNFNRAGGRDPDVGDAFLLRHGFTVVAVGWEFDVAQGGDLMRIAVPVATDGGTPTTGIVRGVFTPAGPHPYRVTDVAAYTPLDPMGPDSTLTVRDSIAGPAAPIPRDRWTLDGATVILAGGFEPGRTYELSFRAANPPIGGLGFAAVRDFASWIKYDPAAIAGARYAYAFGNSQSGRFLRTFLYKGFNGDERDRPVLDAALVNIAGAARIDLNERWGTPISASGLATAFPFADSAVRDPVSGVVDGLLENARAVSAPPKIFYTNTSNEYWSTFGRAAALTHTTPDGTADLPLPDHVRSYLFAGTQHGPGPFPPRTEAGRHRENPVDYWWSMRALLVSLDRWVRNGVPPPASRYPRFDNGTLVHARDVAMPLLPGVPPPHALTAGVRLANPLHVGGAGEGISLPLLVPQVDADGNERAGIRLPEVAVPLATYTGWNFRRAGIGGSHLLVPLRGAYLPFVRTRAEREARGDPRPSIEERYPSRGAYMAMIRDAAAGLVRGRFLLPEDVDAVVSRAYQHWELAVSLQPR